jgi:ABC-type transport system involved in multi-copper enzyme maturation permease subunit
MTWVAWRQHRNELIIVLAMLVALVAYMVPAGLDKHELYNNSGLKACVEAGQDCPDLRFQLQDGYDSFNNIVGWFNFMPGIVGTLLAVPLIAEFEQRTYRLAWSQSVTRGRWLATRLGVALAGVTLFAVVLTLLATWVYAPSDQTAVLAPKDLGNSFDFEGAMPFAYTFFAFTLSLATGVVSRRTSVAMAAGLVGFLALRLLVMELLRDGISSSGEVNVASDDSLTDHTRDWARFWTAQAQEGALFISLATGLLTLTIWQVRRRIS